MNEHIKRIKESALDETKKVSLVLLGALTGVFSAAALRKVTEAHPTLNKAVKIGYPFLLGGGGFLITTMTPKDHKGKYFGYGLEVAGLIEGVKLFPVAKDFLSGVLGGTEISAANAFLTESEERQKVMNGFGLSALPLGNASLSEAPSYETRLPDLQGNENENLEGNDNPEDLGYNGSLTDDTDRMSGIL